MFPFGNFKNNMMKTVDRASPGPSFQHALMGARSSARRSRNCSSFAVSSPESRLAFATSS
jgi:hypothetical protein